MLELDCCYRSYLLAVEGENFNCRLASLNRLIESKILQAVEDLRTEVMQSVDCDIAGKNDPPPEEHGPYS